MWWRNEAESVQGVGVIIKMFPCVLYFGRNHISVFLSSSLPSLCRSSECLYLPLLQCFCFHTSPQLRGVENHFCGFTNQLLESCQEWFACNVSLLRVPFAQRWLVCPLSVFPALWSELSTSALGAWTLLVQLGLQGLCCFSFTDSALPHSWY